MTINVDTAQKKRNENRQEAQKSLEKCQEKQ